MTNLDILLDWLTFSGSFFNVNEVYKFLGLFEYRNQFQLCPGRWFYSQGYTYNNEITIYHGMHGDCTAFCVNISGRGCRDIESFSSRSFDDILEDIYNMPGFKVSRIDLSTDIIDDSFNIQKLISDTRNGYFTCRSKFYNIMESQDDSIKGYSLYFGKKGSNIFINIYDKRAERGYDDIDMPAWTRVEIRLRHENAEGVLQRLFNEDLIDDDVEDEDEDVDKQSLGYIYSGILNNYLRFLKPSKTDDNKSRWKTAKYWEMLLEHTKPVKVFYMPGVEYDYSKFETNFFRQYGSSIVTYLKLHSLSDLQNELELRKIEPNAKQQFLIDNYQEGIDYQIL